MPGRTHRPARAYRRTIRSRDRSARPGFGYPLAFLLASRQALADKNLAEEEVDHQDQHGGGHHGLRTVFPLPVAPMIPRDSPSYAWKDTSASAGVSSNDTLTRSKRKTGLWVSAGVSAGITSGLG